MQWIDISDKPWANEMEEMQHFPPAFDFIFQKNLYGNAKHQMGI